MCRLAYIPGQAQLGYKKMIQFFDHLEKSCGGDGNGYVAIGPKGEVITSKGVNLKNDEIVSVVYHLIRRGWSVYYHTRKISVGWSEDRQCHPFKITGKQFNGYLCHNGTWSNGTVLASYLGVGSDTAALAKVIGKFGINEAEKLGLFPSSGVFLVYGNEPGKHGIHRVIKKYGDLKYCKRTGIWASEFPSDWSGYHNTYTVTNGSHMLDQPAPKYVQKHYKEEDYSKKKGYITSDTSMFRNPDYYAKWELEEQIRKNGETPAWFYQDSEEYRNKIHEMDWDSIDSNLDDHKYS